MKRYFISVLALIVIVGAFLSLPASAEVDPTIASPVNFWQWGISADWAFTSANGPRKNYSSNNEREQYLSLGEGYTVSVGSGEQHISTYNVNHIPYTSNLKPSLPLAGGGSVKLYSEFGTLLATAPITSITIWYGGYTSVYVYTNNTADAGSPPNWDGIIVDQTVIRFLMPHTASNVNYVVVENMVALQGTNVVNPSIQWSKYSTGYFFSPETDDAEYYLYGFYDGQQIAANEAYQDGYEQGKADGIEQAESQLNKGNWLGWMANAVGGFMTFEIFPGFSIGGLFAVLISIALLMTFLRFFAGG